MQISDLNPVIYQPPFPNAIARVAWLPFGVSFHADNYKIQDLINCGFNVIQLRPTEQDLSEANDSSEKSMKSILKQIEQADSKIKVIFLNEYITGKYPNGDTTKTYNTEKIAHLVERFQAEPNLYAWHIKDEPLWNEWHTKEPGHNVRMPNYRNLTEEYKAIIKKYREIRHCDTRPIIFNNLAVPRFEKAAGGDGATAGDPWFPDFENVDQNDHRNQYEMFLDEYDKAFPPSLWSYDVYPITIDDKANQYKPDKEDGIGSRIVHHQHFYRSLQTFWNRSLEKKVPFWAHCRTYYKRYDDGIVYPVPKFSELIWEAFSALAYGAKGIVYFCYGSHLDSDGNIDRSSVDYEDVQCVDRNGIKIDCKYVEKFKDTKLEPIWSYVRETNRLIAYYEPVFTNARAVKVAHALKEYPAEGTASDYQNLVFFDEKDGIGCVKNVVPHGDGVLVSHIVKDNGAMFMVFVNHSPYLEQEVDVYITNGCSFKEYPMPTFEETRQDSTLCHSMQDDSKQCESPQFPITSIPQMTRNLMGGEITFGPNKTADKASTLHLKFNLGGGGFRIFKFS